MEDVVTQHEAHIILAHELLTNDERLCQSIGRRLFGIFEVYPIVAAIAQQTLETWQVVRCRDNQYIPDASQHQYRDGVIHHGFVKDGDELLAHSLGDGVKPCTRTTSEHYSFHAMIDME